MGVTYVDVLAASLPLAGGAVVGARSRMGDDAWYAGLARPSWTPPGWAFPVAWTVLYVAMGAAGALLIRRRGRRLAPLALGLFIAQLCVNYAWTPVFFEWHAVGHAAVLVSALVALVAATIAAAFPVDRRAAYLLVPYLAWLAFAAALNVRIWQLNR